MKKKTKRTKTVKKTPDLVMEETVSTAEEDDVIVSPQKPKKKPPKPKKEVKEIKVAKEKSVS